jgi:hypothetical protein
MPNLITVTSNADSGTGSLREAIANAQLENTIDFASSLANQLLPNTDEIPWVTA